MYGLSYSLENAWEKQDKPITSFTQQQQQQQLLALQPNHTKPKFRKKKGHFRALMVLGAQFLSVPSRTVLNVVSIETLSEEETRMSCQSEKWLLESHVLKDMSYAFQMFPLLCRLFYHFTRNDIFRCFSRDSRESELAFYFIFFFYFHLRISRQFMTMDLERYF